MPLTYAIYAVFYYDIENIVPIYDSTISIPGLIQDSGDTHVRILNELYPKRSKSVPQDNIWLIVDTVPYVECWGYTELE